MDGRANRISRSGLLFACLFLSCLAVFSVRAELADPAESADPDDGGKTSCERHDAQAGILHISQRPNPNPYCGLYCLLALFKMRSVEVEIGDLINTEYVASSKGSSFADLKRAAENHGFHAKAIEQLSARHLFRSQPLILHVRGFPWSSFYDHYILFIKAEGDKVLLLFPPDSLRWASVDELFRIWDGRALLVSEQPIGNPARQSLGFIAGLALFVGLSVAAAGLFFRGRRSLTSRRGLISTAAVQSCSIMLASIVIAVSFHAVSPTGFFRRWGWVSGVQEANARTFFSKVSFEDLLARPDKYTCIDARFAFDFKTGHFPGAINIPADCSPEILGARMKHIQKDAHVAVYCQSNSCLFDSLLAGRLAALGYVHIYMVKGGWSARPDESRE